MHSKFCEKKNIPKMTKSVMGSIYNSKFQTVITKTRNAVALRAWETTINLFLTSHKMDKSEGELEGIIMASLTFIAANLTIAVASGNNLASAVATDPFTIAAQSQ